MKERNEENGMGIKRDRATVPHRVHTPPIAVNQQQLGDKYTPEVLRRKRNLAQLAPPTMASTD